jgi:hypothetical protein
MFVCVCVHPIDVHVITMGYSGLQWVKMGYNWLQWVTMGYNGLQWVTMGENGLNNLRDSVAGSEGSDRIPGTWRSTEAVGSRRTAAV